MAHYASDSELYSDLGECLREVLCDPENADKARGVGSVIRIETVRPQARITLNLAADGDPEVLLGDCDLRPAAVITMEADAARGFFLGEVSLIGALSGGRMTAQGPVAPILRVVPLANLVAPKFQEFDGSGAAPAGEGDKAAEAGDAPEEEAPEEDAADGEPTDDEAEPAAEGDQS
ncbi:MAG: hypothetical protein ACKOTA_00475 [Solirubrobacterales bacterium]